MIYQKETDYRFDTAGRIVAIGDTHGNYDGLVKILLRAGIIDEGLRWISRNTILVQIGDIFGRGCQGKFCCNLLMNLQNQAEEFNSKVIVLLGNHEAMITHNYLKYITFSEMYNFTSTLHFDEEPEEKFKAALSPSSKIGNWIRNLPAAMIINDCLFVHGGLESRWVDAGLAYLNLGCKSDMHKTHDYYDFPVSSPITSATGPLWNRNLLAGKNIAEVEITRTLEILSAKTMIVGHTPSSLIPGSEGGAFVRKFDDKIIGIDVGITPQYGSYLGWLEIIDGRIEFRNQKSEIRSQSFRVKEDKLLTTVNE